MNIALHTAKIRSIQSRKARFWTMTRRNRRRDHLKQVLTDIREQREGIPELPPVPQLHPSVEMVFPELTWSRAGFGNWIPEELKPLIAKHHKAIAEIPIHNGQLDAAALSVRVANVLCQHEIKNIGDFLSLKTDPVRIWHNFGEKSHNEFLEALRLIAIQIERNVQIESPREISKKNIDVALVNFTYKLERALEMRYGLSPSGRFYTAEETGRIMGVCGAWINTTIKESLKRLRIPFRRKKLEGMRQSVAEVASKLWEDRIVLTLEDLKSELKKLDLLKEEDEHLLAPIIHLTDHVFGQCFTYINMKSWEIAPDVTKKNVGLVQDYLKFLAILPPFCRIKKGKKEPVQHVWKFSAYQKMLQEKHNIPISIEELKRIFAAHRKIIIENELFHSTNKSAWIRYRAKEALKKSGPLHIEKIAELTGINYSYMNNILVMSGEFVLVANSTYDLIENHPELKNIPFPKTRKRSGVFAAIYGILRDHENGLEIGELHQKMNERGYKWSTAGILRILHDDEKHKVFFVEERGKVRLKSRKKAKKKKAPIGSTPERKLSPAKFAALRTVYDILKKHGPLTEPEIYRKLKQTGNLSHGRYVYFVLRQKEFICIGGGVYDLAENHPY